MSVMDNPFTCANGHNFRANAKIRARCPQCGSMARRDYKAQEASPTTEGEKKKEHKPITEPVILRQGRTPVATPKKPVAKKPRTPAQLANDKRLAALRSGKTPASKPKTTVAHGIVNTRRITKPQVPKVNQKPTRTAVAGQIKQRKVAPNSSKGKSFMDQVIDQFRLF